jgi:hypothetical protein
MALGLPCCRACRRRQRAIHTQAGAAISLATGITVEYAELVYA